MKVKIKMSDDATVIKKYTKCERYDLTIVNAMNSFNLHRLLEMGCYSNFYSIYEFIILLLHLHPNQSLPRFFTYSAIYKISI